MTGQTGETLSHELFFRDDAVGVRIVPSDWYGKGEEFRTKLVLIENTPPKITSSPSGASSDLYTYQVTTEDVDADTVFYKLEAGAPPGMAIDTNTGLLTWDTNKAPRGDHEIGIQVHDGHGGNSFQRFTLNLTGDIGSGDAEDPEEEGEGTEEGEELEDQEAYEEGEAYEEDDALSEEAYEEDVEELEEIEEER